MKIWPAETSSRPAMQLSRVDLPQPEGPSRTMNSPCSMSRLRVSSTFTLPKLSDRSRMETLCCIELSLHGASGHAATDQLAGPKVADQGHQARQHGRSHVDVVFRQPLG